jgi:hypothetical protein
MKKLQTTNQLRLRLLRQTLARDLVEVVRGGGNTPKQLLPGWTCGAAGGCGVDP